MSEPRVPDNLLLRWQGETNPLLLRWQEDELNEAEKNVLGAFRVISKVADGPLEVFVPSTDSRTPEKPGEGHTADDWQGAILRAGFLRDLFLGNYGKFDPRLIMISRAWIEGQLDLNYCESLLPLVFSQCIFSDGILLRNSIIPELDLSGCEVRRFVFAQGAKIGSNVVLGNGFKAKGLVDLFGASLGGTLICNGDFGDGLNAVSLKAKDNVQLSAGFKANGEVNLSGAEIGRQFICRGLFENGLYAQGLKTGSDTGIASIRIHDDGSVIAFESNGVVDLSGADIGGRFSCCGLFQKGLYARGLKTGSDMVMTVRDGDDGPVIIFDSKGEVNLSSAEIGGGLICHGHFEKGLYAQGLKTSGDILIGDVGSNGGVNLFGAEISGSLDLGGATIGVILDNAKVHGALVDLQKWPRRGSANGFRYQAIESTGDARDWKVGLDWVAAMTESSKFSPQPYEQLMSVYRRMGHTNWARNIGFALEKKRSKEFKGFWQWLTWRPWYGILRWTIGYGYKPFRFVPWVLGLVMAGFLLFSSGHSWQAPAFLDNEWIPSEAEALESQSWKQDRKPPPDYLPFNPLVYSLEAAFPVLPLGQLEKWHPSNGFLLGVRWVWTIIGSLLLAILALFGVGALGPRWRSGDEGG